MNKVFGTKLEGHEYVEREGAYGLVFRADEVAVVKVRGTHLLIGGGVDPDEDIIDCLKREFVEEIGYVIKNIEFIETCYEYHHSKRAKKYHLMKGHVYKVDLDMKLDILTEKEHELIWLKVAELTDELELDYQPYVIKKAFEMLSKKMIG